MLSRALSLATVTLLIGCLAAGAARAVENLEAGKSPSQIFAGTCNACHKSPRGLLKSVPASSLPGFLRQHYTTSSDMASVLASFLVSNGAADTRYQAKDAPKQDPSKKDGKPDAKQEAKQDGKPDQLDRFGRRQQPSGATQEAAKPDADGLTPQGEGGRPGRDAKRLARPGQPDAGKPADGQTPVQAAVDSKQGAKQKLGKRGKPGAEEPAKTEETVKDEAAKTETAKSDMKSDGDKPAAAKPAAEGRSETAKVDAPKESVGSEPTPLRPDPVPPVTPAPAASSGGSPEPAAVAAAPATPSPVAPAVASAPPLPPVAPAGPPAPPISQ